MIIHNTIVEENQYLTFEELTLLFDENHNCIYDFINNGVDIHLYSKKGMSFFMYVLKYCCDIDIIKVLIKNGADVHSRDMFGRTPLIISVKNQDSPDIVKLLLKEGSDSNAIDNYGNSALIYSEIYSRSKKIKSMLEKASKSNCISIEKIKGNTNRY